MVCVLLVPEGWALEEALKPSSLELRVRGVAAFIFASTSALTAKFASSASSGVTT